MTFCCQGVPAGTYHLCYNAGEGIGYKYEPDISLIVSGIPLSSPAVYTATTGSPVTLDLVDGTIPGAFSGYRLVTYVYSKFPILHVFIIDDRLESAFWSNEDGTFSNILRDRCAFQTADPSVFATFSKGDTSGIATPFAMTNLSPGKYQLCYDDTTGYKLLQDVTLDVNFAALFFFV